MDDKTNEGARAAEAHGPIADIPLKRIAAVIALAAAAALAVMRFDDIAGLLTKLWEVASPFVLGCVIAYLMNLVMARWERIWFPSAPKGSAPARLRRPACLLLTVLTFALAAACIVFLISDEIGSALRSLWDGARSALVGLSGMQRDVEIAGISVSQVERMLSDGFDGIAAQVGSFAPLISTVLGYGGKVAGSVLDSVVGLIFALYLLADKERVLTGAKRAARLVLPRTAYGRLAHTAHVADVCFSRFIFGQCMEGIVLGTLCAIGMRLLQMPYASTVGLVVGVGALIPIFGAWAAGIVGALMILPVDAMQAVWFVVFLLALQQVDGHFIYPHVVGGAIGISSLWILVAVIAGGALFGISGILFGVPLVATARTLALEWADRREQSL